MRDETRHAREEQRLILITVCACMHQEAACTIACMHTHAHPTPHGDQVQHGATFYGLGPGIEGRKAQSAPSDTSAASPGQQARPSSKKEHTVWRLLLQQHSLHSWSQHPPGAQ